MSRTVRSSSVALTVALMAVALAVVLAGVLGWPAPAQSQEGKGARIVCWKDKNGKVVGCGDKVPLEYQDRATRETDRTGVTRKTTESAEEAAKRRAQEQEVAKQKAEEQKRLAEQRRQDAALIATFTSDKEIDQKRDRDLVQVDLQMDQMKVSLKNATDRHTEAKSRSDAGSKDKKTAEMLKEDMAKTAAERQRLEQAIAAKEKEKDEIRQRYADQKKRYLELRGGDGSAVGPPPASATAAEPEKKAPTPVKQQASAPSPAPAARETRTLKCGSTTIVCDAGDTVICGGKQIPCK